MRVSEIMTRDLETVLADQSVVEAARKMRAWDVGFLPVMENKSVVGVITDRDITLRGLGNGRDPHSTAVREIMTPAVFWCYENDVLTNAAEIMEDCRVRRLIVLDKEKRLVGILSMDGLAVGMSSDRLLGTVVRNVTAALSG